MSFKNVDLIKSYVDKEKNHFIKGLSDFLSIKSISAQNIGMEECAYFLKDAMDSIGIKTELWELEGAYPVIYGECLDPKAEKTLLIYGHYDVQPPEPLELWDSDPFTPMFREGKIYARGATDDKGNLWATIMAIKTLKENNIELPINLKFFFEGEEEVGSPNIEAYLNKYQDRLKDASYTILCDRGIHESGRPQLYLGNKGIMSVEVFLRGAKRDVHSGQAPLIPNPAWQLIWLLEKLKNEADEILIPGYYDDVNKPSAEDIKLMSNIPFNQEEYCDIYDINDILVEGDGVQVLSKLLFRPTATINGLTSGYQGEGNKTIIPSYASVKMDFRFVDGQNPLKCAELVKDFLKEHAPEGAEIKMSSPKNPSKVSPQAEVVQVAIEAAREVYGSEPVVWPLLDGSGPMSLFEEILDAPAIIIGLGAPFSLANTHAPNENIGVEDYLNGIKLMATIYSQYGKRE